MRDITTITQAITHSGAFHLDDVMATAMVKLLCPDITVVRVSQFEGEGDSHQLVYDIGFGRYDHHQPDRRIADNGVPYCAFGLLFEDYGALLLSRYGFGNTEYAHQQFVQTYVHPINYGDNYGYQPSGIMPVRNMVMSLNAKWYEVDSMGEGASDIQFAKAVALATSILDIWLRQLYSSIEYSAIEHSIWSDAVAHSTHGVVVVDSTMSTKHHMCRTPSAKMVISRSPRGGYSVYSGDVSQYAITSQPEFRYVHPSGFMGVCDNLQSALCVAYRLVGAQHHSMAVGG